jgi:two-component system, LytTR family, sensor kinase
MKFIRSAYFTPLLHIAIWCLLLAIPAVVLWNESWQGLSQLFFFITTLYHIGLFYFNAYFLYPRLLTRKWWWLYIICVAAIIRFSYYAKIYILQLNPHFVLTEDNQKVIFFSLLPLFIASIIFRLISDRIRFERLEKEARTQRLDAELKFLRSQVSPHFLFNMMTNMVSLARQKSDLLEPSLIKLSDLLRYMLYDSTEEKITISNEIENLKNYIALQQLRFGEDVKVDLAIKNDCAECLVEPMLLVPFIENAFKHGVGMIKDPYIKINLCIKDKLLVFEITNNFNPANLSKDKSSGIGLANVKSRLQLLYPEKYHLLITDSNNIFSVQLKIKLV